MRPKKKVSIRINGVTYIHEAEPLGDIHASGEFRAHLARLYTARAIQEAAKIAGVSLTKGRQPVAD